MFEVSGFEECLYRLYYLNIVPSAFGILFKALSILGRSQVLFNYLLSILWWCTNLMTVIPETHRVLWIKHLPSLLIKKCILVLVIFKHDRMSTVTITIYSSRIKCYLCWKNCYRFSFLSTYKDEYYKKNVRLATLAK